MARTLIPCALFQSCLTPRGRLGWHPLKLYRWGDRVSGQPRICQGMACCWWGYTPISKEKKLGKNKIFFIVHLLKAIVRYL